MTQTSFEMKINIFFISICLCSFFGSAWTDDHDNKSHENIHEHLHSIHRSGKSLVRPVLELVKTKLDFLNKQVESKLDDLKSIPTAEPPKLQEPNEVPPDADTSEIRVNRTRKVSSGTWYEKDGTTTIVYDNFSEIYGFNEESK